MILILTFIAFQEKIGGVLFMFVLFLAGEEVKKWLFGKSLSSSLQLVRIEYMIKLDLSLVFYVNNWSIHSLYKHK